MVRAAGQTCNFSSLTSHVSNLKILFPTNVEIYCSEGILLRGYSVKDSMVETVAPEEDEEKFVERIWEASTS